MLGYMLHFLGKIRWILFVYSTKSRTFAPVKHRGVEQLVARWAHNPKVKTTKHHSGLLKL